MHIRGDFLQTIRPGPGRIDSRSNAQPPLSTLLWDNLPMLQLDPSDPKKIAFALHKAVRQSGLSLTEIADRLKLEYGVELSVSGLSRVIYRGTIRLQRVVQILAICGVSEVEIRGTAKRAASD